MKSIAGNDIRRVKQTMLRYLSCRVGFVVSVSTSHKVSHEFASRPGHTKDHHKNGTNCLPVWHASLTVQPDCLKGRVVCGTVYEDMHLKYLHIRLDTSSLSKENKKTVMMWWSLCGAAVAKWTATRRPRATVVKLENILKDFVI